MLHVSIARLFAILHGKSDSCVLITQHQVLWKKPNFRSLQGHTSHKDSTPQASRTGQRVIQGKEECPVAIARRELRGVSSPFLFASTIPSESVLSPSFGSPVWEMQHLLPLLTSCSRLLEAVTTVSWALTQQPARQHCSELLQQQWAHNSLIPLVPTIRLRGGTHAMDSFNFMQTYSCWLTQQSFLIKYFVGISAHFADEWIHTQAV